MTNYKTLILDSIFLIMLFLTLHFFENREYELSWLFFSLTGYFGFIFYRKE